MGKVKPEEVRKAAFIREYRELCERHKLMVVMAESAIDDEGEEWRIGSDGDKYLAFCIGDISKVPEQLGAVIEEMLIEDLMEIDAE